MERTKTASFQVSAVFGEAVKGVLIAEGVKLTDVVLRPRR